MSTNRVLIYLLRRDLRLADNPILHEIAKIWQQSQHPYTHLLSLYVVPAQQIEVSGFLATNGGRSPFPEARSNAAGFWRCGPLRAKFLAESVWNLRESMEKVGSGLDIRVGMLGQVLEDTLNKLKQNHAEIAGVWMTDEEGVEEKREEREVKKAAEAAGVEFKLWVDEKYYIDECDPPYLTIYRSNAPIVGMFPYRLHANCLIYSQAIRRKLSHCEKLPENRFQRPPSSHHYRSTGLLNPSRSSSHLL